MMRSTLLAAAAAAVASSIPVSLAAPVASGVAAEDQVCPPPGFDTQTAATGGFPLDWYANGTWYIQQQMAIAYLPAGFTHCVAATYTILPKRTLLGYDIDVHNHAENAAGVQPSGPKDICSQIVNGTAGKLQVAPCFLPASFAGPYWVVAFDQAEGWALVSGGPPTQNGDNGKCRTGTGVNGSGLWIFTRQQTRDDGVVNKVRFLADKLGFDLSVLADINQTSCTH